MQPVDLTTLRAVHHDLTHNWLPARIETVHMTDLWTAYFCLRTLKARVWVLLSWHPQAARCHLCSPPPKQPDPFQFSQPLQRSLKGLALTNIALLDPWERVLDWQFAPRPGEDPRWHLYLEIMGRYSNAVLVEKSGSIFACGHGVSERQSSVRPVQPGLTYQTPPSLTDPAPDSTESFDNWQQRIQLIPGPIEKRLLKSYRGISRSLTETLLHQAGIPLKIDTEDITPSQWQTLFQGWQTWLQRLDQGHFDPGLTETGYTVLGEGILKPAESVHTLLDDYYSAHLNREVFDRDRHRLRQKIHAVLKKLYQRRDQFEAKLKQSDHAEVAKHLADLLMAHLHEWQPGLSQIELPDFETGDPVAIKLDPEKNAIINAQAYYKKHQKQKRSRNAVLPLLSTVNTEIQYLEQVEDALDQLGSYTHPTDLDTLTDIRTELIDQKYLTDPAQAKPQEQDLTLNVRRFQAPSGFEILVGRNNLQNDRLTFKLAQDTDWWFHAQEIPGSHVLLKLPPGDVADDADLQSAANLAAHYSRGRLSDQVPVVYTRPKHVFKPKGSLPGMVIYKQETVIWGQPDQIPEARQD